MLTWIYNNTKSIFWIVLLHGWSNTVQSYLVLSSDSYTAQLPYGVLPWGIAIYALKRYGAGTLTRRGAIAPFATTPPSPP